MLIYYLVLLYAVGSMALLLAYERTRLFPLYLLKVGWTSFTVLAFAWVVAMSFGESAEYIQHPAGPFAIFVGELGDPRSGTRFIGGYAESLFRHTGTHPVWIVAALLMAWSVWGLIKPESHWPGLIAGIVMSGAGELLLLWGGGRRDAIFFGALALLWLGIAAANPAFFIRHGKWMLLGMLLLALCPLIEPIMHFDWSRYRFAVKNYRDVWFDARIGDYFVNSLMVTITTVSLTTLMGAMAAYVLARRSFTGRRLTYGLIIAAISIPGILIQVPLFLLIKDWGFTLHLHEAFHYSFMDSRLGLACIYTAMSLPFTIFVLTGFFRSLPGELGEASVIDGCGQWRTFTTIYLPLALPGIATTAIFNFLGAWNEFNLGMIFMSNPNFKTLPIGLYELQEATQYTSAWSPMFAGIVLLCLPTFLIFVFLQQWIVAGLTAGGLKG